MDDAAREAAGTPGPAVMEDAADMASETAPDTGSGVADEPTGVAAVDAALERLRDLDGAAVEAHVEIFDDVQRQLHEALAELEE